MSLFFTAQTKMLLPSTAEQLGARKGGKLWSWPLKTLKLCIGTGPGAETRPQSQWSQTSHPICFNVSSSSVVSLAVAADAGCIFTVGMDLWGIPPQNNNGASYLRSRQQWAQQHWKPSLSRLPVKAEHLEGNQVLQLRHWTGRAELQLFLPMLSQLILKVT